MFLRKTHSHCLVLPGSEVLSVMSLTADPGGMGFLPSRSHTFLEIDHEIISTVIFLPLIQEGLFSVTSKSICVHEVLVNRLVKLVVRFELTVST